jgi:hypothetical protein
MDSLSVAAGLQRAYHTRFTILSLCLSRQLRSDCDHDLADGPLGFDQFVRPAFIDATLSPSVRFVTIG